MATYDEQVARFKANEPILDAIVNGPDTADVQTGNGKVPTLAKLLARIRGLGQSAIDSAFAARDAAYAARDQAQGYVGDAVSQGNVPLYSTIVGFRGLNIPANMTEVRIAGYRTRFDGRGGLFAYDPASMLPDDGSGVIRLNNKAANQPGRWIRPTPECSCCAAHLTAVREHNDNVPLPLAVFDGKMYALFNGGIVSSSDEGDTWSAQVAPDVPGGTTKLMPASDGQVIGISSAAIYKSNGWGTGTVTWVKKQQNSGGTAVFLEFGADGDGTRFVVGEYATDPARWSDSTYAWISTDAGNSWIPKYNSNVVASASAPNDSHIHGCCYDRWANRFFVVEGHGPGFGIYYSDDDGNTWNKVTNYDFAFDTGPTTITATDLGIVCGSDSGFNGIYLLDRPSDPSRMLLRWAWEWNKGAAQLNGFSNTAFRDPATGMVYLGFRIESKTAIYGEGKIVIAASDGASAAQIWESSLSAASGARAPFYLTISPRGRLTASIYNEVGGLPGRLTAHVQRRGSLTSFERDPGGVLFGRRLSPVGSVAVGGASMAGFTATAVGVRSNASGEGRIAVGYSSSALGNLSTVVGTGAIANEAGIQAVVIGNTASVTGANSVAVGYGANAVLQAVAIGAGGAQATNTGVAVGFGAKSTNNLAVAIGPSSNASGPSTSVFGANATATNFAATAIGANASATGSSATAVGRGSNASGQQAIAFGDSSTASHTQAIALGAEVATTADNQVAVGNKDIEFGNANRGVILRSPNGTRYRVKVNDNATLSITPA